MNVMTGSVAPTDRGLAFGDGLFETLRWQGDLLWWPDHWTRLSVGCHRLGLPVPDESVLLDAIDTEVAVFRETAGTDRHADLVVKLIHTAGPSQRGYARPPQPDPTTRILVSQRPPLPGSLHSEGVSVDLAGQPMAVGIPALAGLKHLNRLPQVLARAAVPGDGSVFDTLQVDDSGRVLGGTSSNLFWFEQGHWYTPPVQGAMIAGTVRARLIRHLDARIEPLASGRLALAESAFLCNAVLGVLPIGRLSGRALSLLPAHEVVDVHVAAERRLGRDRASNPYTCWMDVARSSMDSRHLI